MLRERCVEGKSKLLELVKPRLFRSGISFYSRISALSSTRRRNNRHRRPSLVIFVITRNV